MRRSARRRTLPKHGPTHPRRRSISFGLRPSYVVSGFSRTVLRSSRFFSGCSRWCRRCSRASTRSSGGTADDRFAGLQWRFVRIKYHHKFESGRVQQDFLRRAVGDRRAGGGAEPLAPDQDGDRDPGRGRHSPDHRRQAPVRVPRGSTSSSRAACGCSPTRSRSCASPSRAAARRWWTIFTAPPSGPTSSSR